MLRLYLLFLKVFEHQLVAGRARSETSSSTALSCVLRRLPTYVSEHTAKERKGTCAGASALAFVFWKPESTEFESAFLLLVLIALGHSKISQNSDTPTKWAHFYDRTLGFSDPTDRCVDDQNTFKVLKEFHAISNQNESSVSCLSKTVRLGTLQKRDNAKGCHRG